MVLELDRREDDNTLVEVSLSDDDALQLFLSTALREVFVVVRTRTDEETFTAVAERVRARIDKHQAKLREADALTREEERKQARQKAEDKYDRWQEKLEDEHTWLRDRIPQSNEATVFIALGILSMGKPLTWRTQTTGWTGRKK